MPVSIRPTGFPFSVPSFYVHITLGTSSPPRRDLVSLTGEQLGAIRDLLRAAPSAPVSYELSRSQGTTCSTRSSRPCSGRALARTGPHAPLRCIT